MKFFLSPEDLTGWVRIQESPDQAANKIMDLIGRNKEQDVVDTCRTIYNGKQDMVDNASKILYGVLASHNLVQVKEGKMNNKLTKEAQMMRQDSVYGNMDMKVCPKLPYSVGKRLISTYNCRHYCLDSITLDDNPNRVYCAEALWRQHVMDKFAREWKNEDGKWVGGYINERFQVYHEDGGNNMQLANGERTRKPRPHQYSTERRLSEGRGEKTTDLTASTNKIIKLAGSNNNIQKDVTYQIFDDVLEMKESGINDEEIITKISEHYGLPIQKIASIYNSAIKQKTRYSGTVYSMIKKAKEGFEGFDGSEGIEENTATPDFPEQETDETNEDIQEAADELGLNEPTK